MVGSVMILLVLFECSLKVGGVDRHHLMRRPMLADSRQVDERCDAPPCELGDALDRFLVMVDAVAPGRLRRIDVELGLGGRIDLGKSERLEIVVAYGLLDRLRLNDKW